jgi:MFS family permease
MVITKPQAASSSTATGTLGRRPGGDLVDPQHAEVGQLRWVVTGYTLMFSALLLFAGTPADRIGARRTYGLGMGLFIAASAACGLAPSLPGHSADRRPSAASGRG